MLSSIACVHPRAQVAFRFKSGESALERVTLCASSLGVGLLSLMLVLFTTEVFLGCHRLRYGQGSKILQVREFSVRIGRVSAVLTMF